MYTTRLRTYAFSLLSIWIFLLRRAPQFSYRNAYRIPEYAPFTFCVRLSFAGLPFCCAYLCSECVRVSGLAVAWFSYRNAYRRAEYARFAVWNEPHGTSPIIASVASWTGFASAVEARGGSRLPLAAAVCA